MPFGTKWQVLHGRRQLVSWDVGLSPLTSATLVISCIFLIRLPRQRGGRRGWCQVSIALTSWARNALQWLVQRAANPQGGANPIKASLSSDCRLKLACMKLESLVTVSQQITVNTFPGLVHTARHTTKVANTRSLNLFQITSFLEELRTFTFFKVKIPRSFKLPTILNLLVGDVDWIKIQIDQLIKLLDIFVAQTSC